jgi:hypothetical protein
MELGNKEFVKAEEFSHSARCLNWRLNLVKHVGDSAGWRICSQYQRQYSRNDNK